MKPFKTNRKIVFAKKNLCIWCRATIKKESYVWRDGKFFCSRKCSTEEKKWQEDKSKLIPDTGQVIVGDGSR